MTKSRSLLCLITAAVCCVLAATAAQAQAPIPVEPAADPSTEVQAPEQGNSASQSVGTVQVGSVTVDPAPVVAATPVGVAGATDATDATGTTAATIGEPGGNHASQSGGTVQIGGNNSATGSAGTAQVSSSQAGSSAQARAAGATASAAAPATVGGSGSNLSKNSVVGAQIGSGGSAEGSTGSLQVQPTTAGVETSVDAGGLAPAAKTDVSISGEQVVGDTLGVDLSSLGPVASSLGPVGGQTAPLISQIVDSLLPSGWTSAGGELLASAGTLGAGGSDDVRLDLGQATAQVVSLERDPELVLRLFGTELRLGALVGVPENGESTAADSLATLQAGGGSTATGSVGTVQIGSLILAPTMGMTSEELGTSAALGGGAGVANGDNSATDSIGTFQIGSVFASPTLGFSSDGLGSASVGGTSGIAGGGNSANGSMGTVQIGGGNSAGGSTGAAQVGAVNAAPTAATTVTPTGTSTSAGGSTGIGGGGNTATDSVGTGQIGGGNTANRSIGAAQSNSVDAQPTASAGDTSIAPGVNVGGSGTGPGNTSTDSIGVVQVGNANTSAESIGTGQVGPSTVGGTPGGGGPGGGPGGEGGATPGSITGAESIGSSPLPGVAAPGSASSRAPAVTLQATPRPRAQPTRDGLVSALGLPGRVSRAAGVSAPFKPPAAQKAKASGASSTRAVLGAKLPFTGISLWMAVLIAGSLLAAGTTLRRLTMRRNPSY
jgi:hypothetical protein